MRKKEHGTALLGVTKQPILKYLHVFYVVNIVIGGSSNSSARGYDATAARLTPDQKVGSSNLSGLMSSHCFRELLAALELQIRRLGVRISVAS